MSLSTYPPKTNTKGLKVSSQPPHKLKLLNISNFQNRPFTKSGKKNWGGGSYVFFPHARELINDIFLYVKMKKSP